MRPPLLKIEGVKTSYGNIPALNGVNLEVQQGEIVSLIGANGAGKSTLMMTICGDPRAREGRIVFRGGALDKSALAAFRRALSAAPTAESLARE